MNTLRLLPLAILGLASTLTANDVIYLNGKVRMQNGGAPPHAAELKLLCPGSDPIRQTVANKKGEYFLKVERDEFNHVARTLSSISMELRTEPMPGSCRLAAVLKGYQSSEINLGTFTIGQDLKLPELVLTAQPSH